MTCNARRKVNEMLQLVATLLRGACADQAEAVLGAHAIPLLRQQIREAVGALEAARRDLAGAMSGLKGEQRALDGISVQIESLSLSAQKALGDGREDLALKACAQIARLEDERTERAASLQRREVK